MIVGSVCVAVRAVCCIGVDSDVSRATEGAGIHGVCSVCVVVDVGHVAVEVLWTNVCVNCGAGKLDFSDVCWTV